MALFKTSMMNMIRIWSQDYDHEKVFYDVVTIDLKTWTFGDGMAVTDAEISTVENHSWKTFDQFKRRAFSVWITNLPNDGSKWSEGTCTCPKFLKKYMCHVSI